MLISRFTKKYVSVFFAIAAFFAVVTAVYAAPTKLSTLGDNESTEDYQVSPNGAYAVYRVSRQVLVVVSPDYSYYKITYDLYSVRLADNLTKKLNTATSAGGIIVKFQISNDSQRVVYLNSQQTNNFDEIYSVPVGGGTIKKLNPNFAANCNTCGVRDNFKFTSDGRYVVFLTGEVFVSNGNYSYSSAFYSVPTAGGTAKTLIQGLPNGQADSFKITPDGSQVAYIYRTFPAQIQKLYSASVTGGAPKYLSNISTYSPFDFAVTPNSQTVVFRTDPDGSEGVLPRQLFSVNINGNSSARLISANNEAVIEFRMANLYNAVVYTTALGDGTTSFTVASTGGDERYTIPTQLSAQFRSLVVTSDDHAVIFSVIRPNSDVVITDIYSIALENRGVPKLITPANYPQDSNGVRDFKLTPDGRRVLFVAAKNGAYLYELFSVAVAGGTIVQINQPFDATDPYNFDAVTDYKISADSKRVVFGASPRDEFDINSTLFSNSTTGGTPNVIGYSLGYNFVITPNSRGILFDTSSVNPDTYFFANNLYKSVFP